MRVADVVTQILWENGIEHVFLVTGGGAMHLNDAIKKSLLCYTCNHHEQASAMAAEGYARASGKPCAVNVTSGPGGLNTLTGVMGQWCDSAPVIYISGQVKFETTVASCPELGLRQLGDQEINIVDIVAPITKYATMITNKNQVAYELEKAIHLATQGRKGPVWVDIPLDIQGAPVDLEKLKRFDPKTETVLHRKERPDEALVVKQVSELRKKLKKAKRPLIIGGSGVRIAGAHSLFSEVCEQLGLPAVTTHNGQDVMESSNPLCVGRIGTLGSRSGNFALQNADLVISVGSRNNIRQVSYAWKNFARSAEFIMIDIDKAELDKPTLKPTMKIHSDAKFFLKELKALFKGEALNTKDWAEWCLERKNKYPSALTEFEKGEKIHPYHFAKRLTELSPEGACFVAANGSGSVSMFQAGEVKKDQRHIWNSGCASMGYDLPAAIGAARALKKPVLCVAGDGSIMMNLQELQTIITAKLPITIYLLNNEGYQSIKQTQKNFFKSDTIGCDEESGVGFPNFFELAKVFGFETHKISSPKEVDEMVLKTSSPKGPTFVEVVLDTNYIFAPKLSSEKKPDGRMVSKPLEDLFPFLEREEFKSNMLVPPLEESL